MNPVIVFLMWSTSFGIPLSADMAEPANPDQGGSVARVKVEITAREDIRTAMHAYMTQGFLSVGGVQLVDSDPRWTIKIVALTAQDNEENVTAVGLSTVVLEHGPQMDMLRTLARAWHYIIKAGLLQKDQPLEVGMRQLVTGIDRLPGDEDLSVLSQHRMCLIPVPKLGEACHDIVTNFNARFLQRSDTERRAAAEQANVADVPVAPR